MKYLEAATSLNDHMLKNFWDDREGAFFFTSGEHEELLFRKKSFHDSAVPSGNSVGAMNLLRLARITGDVQLEQKAERIGHVFSGLMRKSPSAFTGYLTMLDHLLGPSHEVVIVGEKDGRAAGKIRRVLAQIFAPNKVVVLVDEDSQTDAVRRIAPHAEPFKPIKGKTLVYVCSDRSCRKPTTDIDEVIGLLTED
jgi:hypothetical protein